MDASQWIALAALIVSILVPSAVGIRRLGRIEANTETHQKQIGVLFCEVSEIKSQLVNHAKECDVDRAAREQRVIENQRRIMKLEGA